MRCHLDQDFNCDKGFQAFQEDASRAYINDSGKEETRHKAQKDRLTVGLCRNTIEPILNVGIVNRAEHLHILRNKSKILY